MSEVTPTRLQLFGEAVLIQRRRRGMTTREAAEDLSIAPSTLSRIERGKEASLSVYAQLVNVWGMREAFNMLCVEPKEPTP